jgi:hypothetical protein
MPNLIQASILAHLNETGNWPTVHEIFYEDGTKSISDVLPMTEEAADSTWRTNCNKHNADDIGDYRLLPGSPMEDVLQFMRRRASAPTSADTSDVERLQKHMIQEELETLLKEFEENEEGVNDNRNTSFWKDRSSNYWRKPEASGFAGENSFYPDERCVQTKKFKSLGQLSNHMQAKHGATKEETADMFRYFIQRMLPMEIEMKAMTSGEHEVKRDWNFCRCHHPGCTDINTKAYMVDSHVRASHKEMKKDMKMLGWFWGTLHTMMKANPKMTTAEALGQGRFWECKMEGCHQPFQS